MALGVPRSVLLGRVVADGEPLWLPNDTEAVFDYLREQAIACPGCGHPRDETMDPKAEEHYRSRSLKCHACAAREREADRFNSQPNVKSAGVYFTVERVD